MFKKTATTFILSIFLIAIYTSCKVSKACSNCGVVSMRLSRFDTMEKIYRYDKLYWPEKKVWYKDSSVIQQINLISITHSAGNKEIREVSVKHYTFIDLRSRSFYDYSSFSDTATLLKEYTQPDSLNVPGGWNFWATNELNFIEPPKAINDTIIQNVHYKRYQFSALSPVQQRNPVQVGYVRCDKKGTMIQLNKGFSELVDCPLVRVDYLPTDLNPFSNSTEIEFIRDNLSKEELKVFSSWQKYASENPVE